MKTNPIVAALVIAGLSLSVNAHAQSAVEPELSIARGSAISGGSFNPLPNAPTDPTFNYASGGPFPTGALGLYRHPFNNPAGATSVGAIPPGTGNVDLIVGLDNRPDGSLVGLAGFNPGAPAARLVNVNATTGVLTTIASVTGVNAGGVPLGLTIDPRSGAAILGTFTPGAGGGTRLFTLDLATGVATQIGTGVTSAGIALDLSTNCAGQVFAVRSAAAVGASGPLASVNTTSAAMTDIGLLGPLYGNFVAGSGFDFDNTNGQLFGGVSIGAMTITDSSYGEVSLTTGVLTGASLGSATVRVASASACPSAASLAPVTPTGATLTLRSAAASSSASTAIGFRNTGTGAGTVNCTATGAGVSVSPASLMVAAGATGNFSVSVTGAPGAVITGTVTCSNAAGGAVLATYQVNGTISAVTAIPTLSNLSFALMGLLLVGLGAFASRRFS